MNGTLTLPQRPRTVVLLVIAIALVIGIPSQIKLSRARHALAEARAQLVGLNQQLAQEQSLLEAAREEFRTQDADRNRTIVEVAKAEKELARIDPESRWANPPATSPEWNPDSPFVWLHKDILPRLPVSPFTEDGAIQPEAASVLTLDDVTQRTLNEQLTRVLEEYRALEVAKAERTDEHLPGIANQKGEKLTVRVQPLPLEGARLKVQFENALHDAVGEQRASLLIQSGETWIDSQFAQFGSEPKIVSVIRHPGGSYNVSIKSGGSWFSTGGPANLMLSQIPPNLRPMFTELFQDGATGSAVRASQ
jgi:hypothetical protein